MTECCEIDETSELDCRECDCRNCKFKCKIDNERKANWILPATIGFAMGFGLAVAGIKYRRELAELSLNYASEAKKIGKKNTKKLENIVKNNLNNIKK